MARLWPSNGRCSNAKQTYCRTCGCIIWIHYNGFTIRYILYCNIITAHSSYPTFILTSIFSCSGTASNSQHLHRRQTFAEFVPDGTLQTIPYFPNMCVFFRLALADRVSLRSMLSSLFNSTPLMYTLDVSPSMYLIRCIPFVCLLKLLLALLDTVYHVYHAAWYRPISLLLANQTCYILFFRTLLHALSEFWISNFQNEKVTRAA